MAYSVFLEKRLLFIGQFPDRHTAFGVRFAVVYVSVHGDGLVAAVQHKPCDVFHAELGGQVCHTCIYRLPPVFIHIQSAVAVQVFECVAILLDNGDS